MTADERREQLLDVTKSIVREGGKAYLSGHLKQRDPAHLKILLLPFVYESGGSRAVKLVSMDKAEMDFKVGQGVTTDVVQITITARKLL